MRDRIGYIDINGYHDIEVEINKYTVHGTHMGDYSYREVVVI